MEHEVVWLDKAKDDVREILNFIAQDSPANARNYAGSIEEAGRGLAHFPHRGRQFDARYRVLIVRNHLLLYTINDIDRRVFIVRVIDGRRDLDVLLEENPNSFTGDRRR